MLHTLEDFCAYLYHTKDTAQFNRYYYQLIRLSKDSYRERCYKPREISKRGGGIRRVWEPSRPLKRIQRGILPLLACDCSRYATAYLPGKSVRDNALPHLGQTFMVKLDLCNFFGSITVLQIFRAIEKSLAASAFVGCHYLNAFDRASETGRHYNSVLSFYFTKFCSLDGALPQGAPSSPILSNLVFSPMDGIIGEYCEKRHIAYTRYSDDMTFSGPVHPAALIGFVRHILSLNGFRLNDSKTKILGPGTRRAVTGAVVNEKLQASRDYRRKIRQEMYYIQRYGLAGHAGRTGTAGGPKECKDRLLGQIGFVLQLSPENREFQRYKKFLAEQKIECQKEGCALI